MAGTPRYRAIGIGMFSTVGPGQGPARVGVIVDDGLTPGGDAVRTGGTHFAAADVEHQRPEALWRLTIAGRNLPGTFVLRAGEFHAIGSTP